MTDMAEQIAALWDLKTQELRAEWRRIYGTEPPARISRDLLTRAVAFQIQERNHGGLDKRTKRKLRSMARTLETNGDRSFDPGISLKPGARLIREWNGRTHRVTLLEDGFDYQGRRYRSLSQIARIITGAHWSGPRFFGLTQGAKSSKNGVEGRRE